ncbi:hypothetical protein ACFL7D_07110, partial [candidate division KSB1 bacterium]
MNLNTKYIRKIIPLFAAYYFIFLLFLNLPVFHAIHNDLNYSNSKYLVEITDSEDHSFPQNKPHFHNVL